MVTESSAIKIVIDVLSREVCIETILRMSSGQRKSGERSGEVEAKIANLKRLVYWFLPSFSLFLVNA